MSVGQTRLRVALGDYAHTLPLKNKEISSASLAFDFSDIKPVFRAFGAMIREQAFDVSEMAIVSYLQAKAHGKPLVLLPAGDDGAISAPLHALQRGFRRTHAGWTARPPRRGPFVLRRRPGSGCAGTCRTTMGSISRASIG
jgi:hypothetical protein